MTRTWRERIGWALHNAVAHPLSEALHWASGFGRIRRVDALGDWLHDVTVPRHKEGEGQ